MTTQPRSGDGHLQIRIDRETCIGAGQCVHWASDVFEQDREAKAFVRAPHGGSEALVVKAMQSCPVEAITLDVGGVVVGPRDVANWVLGATSDDPLVARLAGLADAHGELRDLMERVAGGGGGDGDRVADDQEERTLLVASAEVHLRDELDAYLDMGELVAPEVLDSFVAGHARLGAALRDLADDTASDLDDGRLARAVAVIDEQIRLEESVLFPLVLASILRRESEVV